MILSVGDETVPAMSKPVPCPSGKNAYRDEETAIGALRHVRAKFNDQGPLHPYLCRCGQWHLGHSEQGYVKWKKRRAHERRVTRARTRKARAAVRRARPMLFLDVDGTIAPLRSGVTAADVDSDKWALLHPGRVGDLSVPYRPAVVDRLMALRRADLIEVRWLTSWEPEALTAWTAVGLGPFRCARPVEHGRRRWWKANVVETWMKTNPDRRAIWADDELTHSRLRGFDKSRLFTVSPNPAKGLTDRQLHRIERWIEDC